MLDGDVLFSVRPKLGNDVRDSFVEAQQVLFEQSPYGGGDDSLGRREKGVQRVVRRGLFGAALYGLSERLEAGQLSVPCDRYLCAGRDPSRTSFSVRSKSA